MGWGKAARTVFVIVVPFLGLLIYLIAHTQELGHRDEEAARASQA